MEAELSHKTFESRLTYIKERYLTYVDIKETSPFVIVALHEHLGLSNYIRIIVQALCNN
jgi:TnpA family transposase